MVALPNQRAAELRHDSVLALLTKLTVWEYGFDQLRLIWYVIFLACGI